MCAIQAMEYISITTIHSADELVWQNNAPIENEAGKSSENFHANTFDTNLEREPNHRHNMIEPELKDHVIYL